MASATCLPVESSGSISAMFGRFDESTVIVIECGIRIADIMNNTIADLSTLSVLTSAPEVLSETDVEVATEILGTYLNRSKPEVVKDVLLVKRNVTEHV